MGEDRRSGAGPRLYLRKGRASAGSAIGFVEPSPLYVTVYAHGLH